MPSGLVYLRPKPIVFYRIEADAGEGSEAAWTKLRKWCAGTQFLREAKLGYGIVYHGKNQAGEARTIYEAGIELPTADYRTSTHALGVKMLPSGPYFRQRYVGGFSAIERQTLQLRENELKHKQFEHDETRPAVEAFLLNPCNSGPPTMKVDLLIPIALAENAKAA
ncbi:MAG: GyrI-like domain-containing protein [Pseudomonadota bacterium]